MTTFVEFLVIGWVGLVVASLTFWGAAFLFACLRDANQRGYESPRNAPVWPIPPTPTTRPWEPSTTAHNGKYGKSGQYGKGK